MTMAELLDTLIQRAKVEAQDAHRGLLCALNGNKVLRHDAVIVIMLCF